MADSAATRAEAGARGALEVLYGGWETYQQNLAAAISTLTDEQLLLRAGPDLRSVGELLTHIVAVRAAWFHGDLGMGGEEYWPIAKWEATGAPPRSAQELRDGLEQTWRLIRESLAAWAPSDLTQTFTTFWPGDDELFVRGWIVWHVIEHDLHHGGELGYMLGMHGLRAPDI